MIIQCKDCRGCGSVISRPVKLGRSRTILLEPFRESKRIHKLWLNKADGTFHMILNNKDFTEYVFPWGMKSNEVHRSIKEIVGEDVNFKMTGLPDLTKPLQLKLL